MNMMSWAQLGPIGSFNRAKLKLQLELPLSTFASGLPYLEKLSKVALGESFDVTNLRTWTVNPQFEHIAQPFIKHLTFRHGKCIDAFGQKRKVTEAGQEKP